MLSINCEIPLPTACLAQYKGIAFDGCWFYLTQKCDRKIIRFDKCFQESCSFDTCRCYSYICYDPNEHCFWASTDHCSSIIYKLNECFHEIDCIHIYFRNCHLETGAITGISYDCCCNKLVVSFISGVAVIDPNCPEVNELLIKSGRAWVLGVVAVCPYYICYCLVDEKRIVRIYSSNGKLIKEKCIPNSMDIESAVFFPCDCDPKCCHFYVLVNKCCCPYLIDCVLNYTTICDNICECNYSDCCCHHHKNECHDCHKNCCEILESIALIEAAISHILNAEGEKLQKIIANSDDPSMILEFNKSVNKTIISATHLEQLLYEKLESVKELCDWKHKPCQIEDLCCDPEECQ